MRDFKDNFGNSAAYSLQKFVDEVVKPSYIDSSQSSYEYQDIYKIYLSKFFQNGTLEKNFPKYWNTWIFYLYPFNVSQYGIGKYVFFNNNTKEITERYPKGDY